MTIAEICEALDRLDGMDAETREKETEFLKSVYAEMMEVKINE